ncbi:transcriptional regulator [Prolixibacter sp. SD074]|nr:transcriptional regulator [Prolixibacter sp. SD074]
MGRAGEIDSLLHQLDLTMKQRKQYEQVKLQKIKNIKNLLNEPGLNLNQRYYINNRILDEYIPFNFDSALHYIDLNFQLARDLENKTMLNETHINLSGILASSGRYEEALDILHEVDRKHLSEKLLPNYYNDFMHVYSDLNVYNQVKENAGKYYKLYKAYRDSVVKLLDPNSEAFLAIKEKQYRDAGEYDSCRWVNSKRLAMAQMGTREYSMITFDRSLSYQLQNNTVLREKYLILSAMSDIRAAVKDNASMAALSTILYKENKIDRAYEYVKFSFEDAAYFNSRLRYMQISNILPVVTAAYQSKSDKQKAHLRNLLIIISLLSLVLLLSILFIYNQVKKLAKARKELQTVNLKLQDLNVHLSDANTQLNELNNRLSESNHVKEQYIGNFFSICSDYIDKLDGFRRNVNKQIADREVAELFEKTRSKRLIEDEIREFYDNFDHTFLQIYPDFVENFNALLNEDEKIVLKKGELLNTELRIFALIRLGINDSANIAKLLRYSVNTIYNYRVKVKNRAAVPRDVFEDYVMKIGEFSQG